MNPQDVMARLDALRKLAIDAANMRPLSYEAWKALLEISNAISYLRHDIAKSLSVGGDQ